MPPRLPPLLSPTKDLNPPRLSANDSGRRVTELQAILCVVCRRRNTERGHVCQADRDRISLEEDRAQYARNIADTEYLTRELASMRIAMGDIVTRDFLRSELRGLLEDIADEREGREPKDKKHKKKDRDRQAPVLPPEPAAAPIVADTTAADDTAAPVVEEPISEL